jgi:hypothetical protein
MSRGLTVNDLAEELRSLLDEFNDSNLDIERDVLPVFNDAQLMAYGVLARSYPEPLLTPIDVPVTSGTITVELPESLFGDALREVEWIDASDYDRPQKCDRVLIRKLSQNHASATVDAPRMHAIYGRNIRFNQPASGRKTLRLWALREPDQLLSPFGRILNVDETNNILYLTDINTDYDVTSGDYSYVNIIDGQTGLIKGTVQILEWDDVDTARIKTVPDAATVMGKPVNGDISSAERDDYLCFIRGTCVLQFSDVIRNFIKQYAIDRIKRNKLGYPYDVDNKLVDEFRKEMKKAYMGRMSAFRVWHNNPNWLQFNRLRYYRRG